MLRVTSNNLQPNIPTPTKALIISAFRQASSNATPTFFNLLSSSPLNHPRSGRFSVVFAPSPSPSLLPKSSPFLHSSSTLKRVTPPGMAAHSFPKVAGDDLSDLAVEYSICPSKEEGGMLGWVKKGQMVPEFEDAAFNAPVNKVVRCKTKFGWHLLQVLSEREESTLQEIQPNELHARMQDPEFLQEAQLIDVREPEEVVEASLPGFQVLPLRQFGSWGPEISTKFDLQKDTYVLCHHGMRSLQVAKWLQTQGFRRVYNVSGGIHAYATKADPSVPTY